MYENHTLLSDSEVSILSTFLDLRRHYFSEIVRITKLSKPRALRALRKLENRGIFSIQREANVTYYSLVNIPKTRSILSHFEYNKTEQFLQKNKSLKRGLHTFKDTFDKSLIIAIFGSYVKGYAKKSSDIDILLIKELFSKSDLVKIEELFELINGRTGLNMNPYAMKLDEFKNNTLSLEIIDNHILVEGGELFYKVVLSEKMASLVKGRACIT